MKAPKVQHVNTPIFQIQLNIPDGIAPYTEIDVSVNISQIDREKTNKIFSTKSKIEMLLISV